MNVYKALMAKHRRMEAEFLRGIRISMYRVSEMPPTESEIDLLRSAVTLIGCILACAIMLISGCYGTAHADTIPDDKAVMAIIGEAENQGYEGMKACACTIRVRGSLKGVYGYNAPRIKKHLYSEDTEAKAIVAWQTSADPKECEYMQGSTHWENIKAFGKPYWADSMTKTVLIKDHQFYREN